MNTLKRDSSGLAGQIIGLGPIDVAVIPEDTAITYLAITPATDVDIYFSGGAELTYTVAAGTPIVVTSNLRLSTETTCLVY
jgi:hypothetical protein